MNIRSIPPITSTGNNRRKTLAPLNGLAHMSLGRYLSEMNRIRQNDDDNESWSVRKFAKPQFNRKTHSTPTAKVLPGAVPKIYCKTARIERYNKAGDFALSLQFDGLEFLSDEVTVYPDAGLQNCFLVPVSCGVNLHESCLLLTTIGDIFEYEVLRDKDHCCIGECFMGFAKKTPSNPVQKEFCPNRLFRDEAYFPELLTNYDPSSMQVFVKNNQLTVTYKKKPA